MESTTPHGPENHVRRAAPDLWPLGVTALALVLGAILLIADSPESGEWGIVAGAAAAVLGASMVLWARARASTPADGAELPELSPYVSWTLAFEIREGLAREAVAPGGLVSRLDELVSRPGQTLTSARVLVSPESAGPTQVVVETVWSESGPEQDTFDRAIEQALEEHAALVVHGSAFRLAGEVVRDRRERARRVSFMAGSAAVVTMAVVGLGLASVLAAFQEGGGAAPPADGVQPTSAPAVFDGVIVEKGIKYLTTEFRLPPETEVTLVEDNQDPSVPHNIRFFASAKQGGDALGGCLEGCEADELATPVRVGPATNPFTFVTPGVGTYAFQCDVHPTTMVGSMIIEEGAAVPE